MFRPRSELGRSSSVRRGLTLVEALIAIGIIGVLLAILIPSLRGARSSAFGAISLSRLKDNTASLHLFAAAHQDTLPVSTPSDDMNAGGHPGAVISVTLEGQSRPTHWVGISWFYQDSYWHLLLFAAGFQPTDAWHGLTNSGSAASADPSSPPWLAPSEFKYSHSFLARPEHWRRGGEQAVEQWGAVKVSRCLRPAAKVAMFEGAASVASRSSRFDPIASPRPCAFLDGHANMRAPRDATEPVPNTFINGSRLYFHGTEDGIEGYDF